MKTLAAVLLIASACSADQSFLLTDNKPSQDPKLRGAQRVETKGSYQTTPAFSGGETNKTCIAFAEGALTDGDVTYNYKKSRRRMSIGIPPDMASWSSILAACFKLIASRSTCSTPTKVRTARAT